MPIDIATLILAAKENADKVNDDQIDDAEWTRHIRNAIIELHGWVANAYRDTFYASQNFTIAAGSNSFDLTTLPAPGFRRVKGIDSDPDTLNRMALRPYTFHERASYMGYALAWWGVPFHAIPWVPNRRYHVLGTTIQIQPQELAAGNYRLYYVPAPTLPTGPTDILWTLDPELERWAEYIEVAAGRRGLWKEESDTRATLDVRLKELRGDILDDAEQDENPQRVTDVGWGG